jgi:HSP20 family protein
VVEVNLPGIDPAKISIIVQEGFLKITGNREEIKETKEKEYYFREIKRGEFERNIRLPLDVYGEKAMAEYHQGVLIITLPMKAETKPNKIKVDVH